MSLSSSFTLIQLNHLGIITCNGADTIKFLQGQTTCDVSTLAITGASFGAICTPKGRMIASFLAFKLSDTLIWLVMDKSIIESTLTHLKKYAVFFKTHLTDEPTPFIYGALDQAFNTPLYTSNNEIIPNAHSISLMPNKTLILSEVDLSTTHTVLATPDATSNWLLSDIAAGQLWITDTLLDSLIPQMINLQALGGISFTKGCYTGQEIVARMKYLGQLKKRMFHISLSGEPPIELSIRDTSTDKKLGEILTFVEKSTHSFSALAILNIDATAQSGTFTYDGGSVTVQSLPYIVE